MAGVNARGSLPGSGYPDLGVCTSRFYGSLHPVSPAGSSRGCSSVAGTFTTALRTPWASGGYDKSTFDVDHNQNMRKDTDRTARIAVSVAICRTFSRSVLAIILTRVGDSIARISRIATADPTSEIGGFAGLLGLQRQRGRCGRYRDGLYGYIGVVQVNEGCCQVILRR